MKKILILLLMILLSNLQGYADTMKFSEAYTQSKNKPVAVFIYAPWVDNAQTLKLQFDNIQNKLGNKYNYVVLDVSDKDTKNFNAIFPIYTMPYVFTFRAGGKISRYFDTNCLLNDSCIISRMNAFLR